MADLLSFEIDVDYWSEPTNMEVLLPLHNRNLQWSLSLDGNVIIVISGCHSEGSE